MSELSSNRIAWQYHADDGSVYRVAALKAFTDQNKLGGEVWDGTNPPKPANIKMRRISLSDGAGHSRVVPVYTAGATICTAGEAFNVNILQVETSLTSSGNPIPQGHMRESVTKQST
jgi:hypothetical protein